MVNLIGQRLGQYEIVARFGEGGMATVYRARQPSVKREVAVKVIQPALAKNETFAQRFERECEVIAQLSHPHIVKMFDYGKMSGVHLRLIDSEFDPKSNLYYFVMELLTGGNLSNRLGKGIMPIPEIRKILSQMAPALDYANGKGYIHRDLKPANVLFDDQGNAFITDFGIAKMLDETNKNSLTQEGTTLGTPSYMSPELWMGENIGPWTDIYALGVVLFEMLTGKLPFVAGTPYRIMHMHVYDPPPSVKRFNPDLPTGMDDVIRRVMAKLPEDRFPTATAMLEEFEAVLGNARAPEIVTTPRSEPQPSARSGTAAEKAASSAQPSTPNSVVAVLLGVILVLSAIIVVLLIVLASANAG